MPGLRGVKERWTLAVRLLVPAGALLVEGWPALVGALVVQEAGLFLARCLCPLPRFASRLFLAAFGLRAALAIPLHVAFRLENGNGGAPWLQDDFTYDLIAEWLGRIARGDGMAVYPGHQHLLEGLYPYLLTGIYAVLGHTPLVPKLLNASLAALSAVLIAEIGRRTFRPTVGAAAGLGAMLLPSLVVWSIVTLKEMLLLFGVLVVLRCLVTLGAAPVRSAGFANAAVACVAALALVADLRGPLLAILGGLLAATLLYRSANRVRRSRLALAGLLVLGLAAAPVGIARARAPDSLLAKPARPDLILHDVRFRRAQEGAARSGLRAQTGAPAPGDQAASYAEPISLMGDILEPLGFALLAPAPWQARSGRDLAASAEMLVWYALLAAAPLALAARPRQPFFAACLAVYGAADWLLLAASEGNLGNLVRHRLMLTPTLLVLGGAGWLELWPRLAALRTLAGAPRAVSPSTPPLD